MGRIQGKSHFPNLIAVVRLEANHYRCSGAAGRIIDVLVKLKGDEVVTNELLQSIENPEASDVSCSSCAPMRLCIDTFYRLNFSSMRLSLFQLMKRLRQPVP